MAIPLKEIIEKKTLPLSWYKLLARSIGKEQYSRIPNDEEVSEVLWLLQYGVNIHYMYVSQLIDNARREDAKTMLIKQQSRGTLDISEASEIILTESDLPHTKLEDFNLLLVLGKGSFGKVCVCICMCACACVCMCVCKCMCVCVYACIRVYVLEISIMQDFNIT